jgi:hypothetical protein
MELEKVIHLPTDHPRAKKGEIPILQRRAFAVGIDVGQAYDPSTICVVSKLTHETLNPDMAAFNPEPKPRFEVHHLERLQLGMPYPQQVDHVAALLLSDPLVRLNPSILLDFTGVGRPVFDMFRERPALQWVEGVVITGGRETSKIAAGWSVPKAELVSKIQALLHSGHLKIPRSLPDASVLARELQDFRVRYTDAGNAVFNAREGAHDDLVLALALAVFGVTRSKPALPGSVKVTFARR